MSLEVVRSGHEIDSIEFLRKFCRCKYSSQNRKESTYAEQLGPLLETGAPNVKSCLLLLCKLSFKAS